MSYQLIDYITIYAKEWDNLVTEFLRHLAMTSFAVIFALLLAVPLGILITHSKLLSKIIIGFANIMQSIPCMALLALGIPILHVGETLAIFMVFVYAFLPILKSTYTGISSISPVSVEVGDWAKSDAAITPGKTAYGYAIHYVWYPHCCCGGG